ncbi:hypothetical protein ACIGEI_12445 [Pseudomonas sp. NPDC078863]|uniref:hypothetical protein n=1 Tax=unclassified Pseudomonas TaxID=196821 RepID=UPI0037CA3544
MSASTELAQVPPKETALSVYSTANGLDPWLSQIRAEVDKFLSVLPDLATDKGRKAFASMAHKVAKSKTALDAVGKELSAQQKEVPKRIDAERKRVWDTLESWQKEIRKPLDDWEEAEERRTASIKDDIAKITALAVDLDGITAEDLSERIARIDAVAIADKWAEFQVDAALAKESTLNTLRNALAARQKYEADQAELAQRRADDEARAQRERDEQIRKEAAEKAQKEADETARRERDQAEQRELQLKQQAEDAERREMQAKAEKEAAEQRAEQEKRDSAARAEQAAEEARKEEQARQKAAADEIIRQQNLREADKAHKSRIMGAAKEAIISMNVSEELAKAIVLKIARGEVPNVTINF